MKFPKLPEELRIRLDCKAHGGVQSIATEQTNSDETTHAFVFACKDGSVWKEESDYWRDNY